MHYLEEARKRAQRAVAVLRADGVEQRLIDALGSSGEELTNVACGCARAPSSPRGALK